MRIHWDMMDILKASVIQRKVCWIRIPLEERILVGVFDFEHGSPRAESGQSAGSGR